MSKLRINCFALSLEGYGAGPRQDLDNPLGVGGEKLHEWFLNGIDLVALGYRVADSIVSEAATHILLTRGG